MAYIGKQPLIGNFQVCDAISTVNGQAAYTLQVGGANVSPETVNNMIVSVNGVIQKPGVSYNVAGSTISFTSALVTGDVIDFIQILGNVLDLGTPSDATVTTAKIADGAVTSAKLASGVGGKILQVVNSENTYANTVSSTSYADVSSSSGVVWETSITPSSSSNKILVNPALLVRSSWNGGADARTLVKTLIKVGAASYVDFNNPPTHNTGGYDYGSSGLQVRDYHTYTKIYTASSLDIIKFKFQISCANANATVEMGFSGSLSTCSLMEIGA